VRIGFAPARGSSFVLAEMHERASNFRRRREAKDDGASQSFSE